MRILILHFGYSQNGLLKIQKFTPIKLMVHTPAFIAGPESK